MIIDRRAALSLAIAHFLFVVLIAGLILIGVESDWPMYWMLLVVVDFPASLILQLISYVVWLYGVEAGGGDPLLDVPNFWLPLMFFATIGTIWWYLLGILLCKIFRFMKLKFMKPNDLIS